MNSLIKVLARSGLLKGDLDLHLVRVSMVLIFLLFGYQKWFEYEAQTLIPFISNGPLTFWMYPVFGLRGASYFLGVSECDCTANAEFARSIYPASFTSTGNARFPSDHSNAASSQDFLYDCESL